MTTRNVLPRLILVLTVFLGILVSPPAVSADTGVGIIVGDPTGISASFYNRVAVGAAWDIDDFLHLHADVWVYNALLADPVNWYIGLGGKMQLFDVHVRGNSDNDHALGVGVRVPVGLQWYFLPEWELFGELVPGIGIIPDTDFDFDAGIGIRYHF
jgi:hypothetical protein